MGHSLDNTPTVVLSADEAHTILMAILLAEAPTGAWYLTDDDPSVDISPLLGEGGRKAVNEFLGEGDGLEFHLPTDEFWRSVGSGDVALNRAQSQSLVECLKYELVDFLDHAANNLDLVTDGVYVDDFELRINLTTAENAYRRLIEFTPPLD